MHRIGSAFPKTSKGFYPLGVMCHTEEVTELLDILDDAHF